MVTERAKRPSVRYEGGTLVLEDVGEGLRPGSPFQFINHKWRCPAVHYATIQPWLRNNHIRDRVPAWQTLTLQLSDPRTPHTYQTEALAAWHTAHRWGSVVLPTGSGKTFVALKAIAQANVSTLVVVPTIDLLHQWYARLENAFQTGIGVWYGLEKDPQPITVTTYASAWAQAEALGNQFKLIIFDEIHHLPAPSWHEIALIFAAPFRLGLTATYPGQAELGGVERAALLDRLVGRVVYRKRIDELTGKQLAEYRTERIRVDLTLAERAEYDLAYETYTGFVRSARLREQYGPGWWSALTRLSAQEQAARRAKVAELRLKEIVHQAQAKLEVIHQILREHGDRPILIFTAHNRFAYAIARRYLLPVITHQTKAAERKAVLAGFREGAYRAIVTSKVLNEGVDVPEAKVAVVLGGSAGAREYVQRLGRVLRKFGNAEAVLLEVIARKTVDEGQATRRRAKVRYHIGEGG